MVNTLKKPKKKFRKVNMLRHIMKKLRKINAIWKITEKLNTPKNNEKINTLTEN
jgi:transcription termination factor Rho